MLLKKERQTTLSEDISARVKVKVLKPEPDALRHLYGEHVQTDEHDQEYFVVPAHQAKYTREVFPRYTVSDEFLPDEEIDKLRVKSKEVKIEQNTQKQTETEEGVVVKKKVGNPNFGKKRHMDETGYNPELESHG
jgi:hypothetical protein